ncbi:MAG: tRNA(Ile)-lysidine synthase TilS/MesJ [Chloroflexi bacterium]|jgi:uncharacterized protein (TIGR00269 family)|nr:MAG: tRNA(Ile)-lysidine synthase TilS/MesJ [Chloroflexota bacterium]
MRCVKCPDKAVIELRRHHSPFCKPHFIEYFENQVERAVRRQGMLSPDDRIMVAVSGGKDSLTLWYVLNRMGYNTTGLHIHLGIGEYSDASYDATLAFAKQHDLEVTTVDLSKTYGMNVPDLSKALRRVACSGCGLSKRYIMNKEAHERGFDVVATGHNLDDEAATLMGNVLHWQMGYLARQAPVLEATTEKLVKKVKPLYTVTERETAAYALLHGIDYVEEECPNAFGAKSLLYKDALNRIELESPGAKHQFLLQFFENARPRLEVGADEHELRDCAICGQATTTEVCAFCRMWQQAKRRVEQKEERRQLREAEAAAPTT